MLKYLYTYILKQRYSNQDNDDLIEAQQCVGRSADVAASAVTASFLYALYLSLILQYKFVYRRLRRKWGFIVIVEEIASFE